MDATFVGAYARVAGRRSITTTPLRRVSRFGYYYVMRYISERSTDPGLLVLSSLAEGPKHGYAITRDVEEVSGIRLGPGTLYGALSRLEGKGLIEPMPAEDRRKPYRLTSEGSAALSEQLEMLGRVVHTGLDRLRIAAEPA
jgi:DNA-binding PadR family transcriptional regulator